MDFHRLVDLNAHGFRQASGYCSDELDEPDEETPATKKLKSSKVAQGKWRARKKETAKKNAKKADGDKDGGEEDAYTALSKPAWGDAAFIKPPVGNFETCVKCEKQFTVVRDY